MSGQRPDFIVRAKLSRKDAGGNDIFYTCGAAWKFRSGTGFNVRLNLLPIAFDGTLVLVEPKDEER